MRLLATVNAAEPSFGQVTESLSVVIRINGETEINTKITREKASYRVFKRGDEPRKFSRPTYLIEK